jgi:hypothetical protein
MHNLYIHNCPLTAGTVFSDAWRDAQNSITTWQSPGLLIALTGVADQHASIALFKRLARRARAQPA